MKRRLILLVVALGVMIVIAASASRKQAGLLILEWAAKAPDETFPVAVLIEMGLRDAKATDWSGRATVGGARVVHREGYRFRSGEGDKLTDPDGWQASSHRGLRLPPRQPALLRLEPIATVGVVVHLADVKDDAMLTVEPRNKDFAKTDVSVKELLTGEPKQLWGGAAVVRRISAAMPVVTAKTEDDFPAACYGPDGTLWLAYISYTVKEESRRIEPPPLKEQPKDFKAYYTPDFGDQLFVKYYRGGKWSEPIAVTGPKEDLVRCAIAADKDRNVWVTYSAKRRGRYDIYARKLDVRASDAKSGPVPRMGPEQRVGSGPKDEQPNLNPVMCTDNNGTVHVAWQSITVLSHSRVMDGSFTQPGWTAKFDSLWYPSLGAAPNGKVAIALDGYHDGDYDVTVWVEEFGQALETSSDTRSSRFEARPSVCYDPAGRLWVAYEEGPEKWGKDYGALVPDKGNPLYNERSVRVVCLQDGKLFKPVAELPTAEFKAPSLPFEPAVGQRFESALRYAYPKIGIDGKGRVWLTYRQKFGSRYTTHPGSYWLTFARRLDGDKWSEPIEIHHSDGLLDDRPVLLPHKNGGLLVIHNTDGRYTTPEQIDNNIYMSYVDLPGEPVEPKLVPHEPGKKNEKLVEEAKEEREAVRRMRDYRIEARGKKYQLLRGEFHRHTEISWDGGPDGSLEDMFRYAIDAAALDWIGNTDHDNGAGREYSWWLTQKFTDAYHIKGVFTPMFSYERSVPYPHGHRNCIFAKRGVRTLPRLAEPDSEKQVGGIHADDTKMLYRYLKELGGICASHTSATSMGTDWRDHDAAIEPVVEIYQGDRMSYEREGAPRAGYDPKTGKQPANVAGWFPKGFINHALDKGYRLGFQSSSDHWSTHISYTVVLAERHDREAILDALKKRHCYGATDNILVDVRSGDHLMGDEFKTSNAPVLQLTVTGTQPLAAIAILKDGEVVETIKPGRSDYKGKWTDPEPAAGVHYYYVRVQQSDGELAWASPMWIEYAK